MKTLFKKLKGGVLKMIPACLMLLCTAGSHAQTSHFSIHTENNMIIGPCGDTIVPHGINYAPYSWGYDNTQLLLDQVALTGANIVRMTWYANTTAPDYTDALLDSAISKCIRNKMIPVIELHDNTCLNDYDSLVRLAHWYVRPAMLAIIQKYNSSLIINIANEAGYVNWSGSTAQAQQAYINAYDSISAFFRRNGVYVPMLIDAPDCGTSIDVFSNVAQQIIAADPVHNVIFSAHAYWYVYADNDSATMQQKIDAALAGNFPLVMGEVANYQDDNGTYCTYALNYQALLHICTSANIGWMTWSWNNDDCFSRQLSTNGNYDSLSPYGNDIVNNPVYGLHTVSKLDEYLANGGVPCSTTAVEQIQNEIKPYIIYTEDGHSYFKSLSPDALTISACDILGRQILDAKVAGGQTLQLSGNTQGIDLLRVWDGSKVFVSKYLGE